MSSRSRLPAPLEQDRTVLIIEPARATRAKAAAVADALGYRAEIAADPFEAHAFVDAVGCVLAAHPSSADIYPRLRASGLGLVVGFAARTLEAATIARELGADAYVIKPYRRESLEMALYAAASARALRARARDTEIGLLQNGQIRMAQDGQGQLRIDLFKTLLPLEIRRARRHGYPIAICVVSVDAPPGSSSPMPAEAVASVCEPLVRGAVRDVDLAVRYTEGRFLVFLPHTNAQGAEAVARRIITRVRTARVRTRAGLRPITASVGIASPRQGKVPSFSALIRDAHAALKAAQLKGGDQSIVR